MSEPRPERRLAAILATDVAGYSRLMNTNEEATLARLNTLQKAVMEPAIEEFRGRIVKTMGDGILAEFASAVDAVRAAVKIQRGTRSFNAEIPEQERLRLRIGVNIGDLIYQGADVFGDGVNIAARLQSIAELDGIFVSQTVRDYVREEASIIFDDLGARALKNIDRPVRVFRVRQPGDGPAPSRRASVAFRRRPGNGYIKDRYFSDAIADRLTTALARLPGGLVIARETGFAYRGRAADAKAVMAELQVRYLLEGTAHRDGNQVRITARLVDGQSGATAWQGRFDKENTALAALEGEVIASLGAALGSDAAGVKQASGALSPVANVEADDLAMQGWGAAFRPATVENVSEAKALFGKVLAAEADNREARLGLAYTLLRGLVSRPVNERRARPAGRRGDRSGH